MLNLFEKTLAVLSEVNIAGKNVKSTDIGRPDSDNKEPYVSVSVQDDEVDGGEDEDDTVNQNRDLKPAIDAAKRSLARPQ